MFRLSGLLLKTSHHVPWFPLLPKQYDHLPNESVQGISQTVWFMGLFFGLICAGDPSDTISSEATFKQSQSLFLTNQDHFHSFNNMKILKFPKFHIQY